MSRQEGSRRVLLSDVALEMLLSAARGADPTIKAHRVEYGMERRDVISFFVPVITVVREDPPPPEDPPAADPAQLPETG